MLRREETICAPATSHGGAIAVIRISGPDALQILGRIFYPTDKNADILNRKGYSVLHGEIRDKDGIIDEVLVSLFKAPHSYTGEDSAEISCHGSSYIVSLVLDLLLNAGASIARPGEFTQRAFLNGKMDLSQAEAVADLVASASKSAHRIAINQIRGGFSAEISKLRSEFLRFASLIELELDFGEEDVEFADRQELMTIIQKTKDLTDRLSSSFKMGNAIKNGIPVAIVGKPNSGKSTLLNFLLNEDKAIVTDIPGTTRDSIEDTLNISGLIFRFIDTAGLRDTSDIVEGMGIRKTLDVIARASVVMMVDEASEKGSEINRRADDIRRMITHPDCRFIVLVNKIDNTPVSVFNDLSSEIRIAENERVSFISAKYGTGIDELKDLLLEITGAKHFSDEDVIVTSTRHYEALQKVSESTGRIMSGLENDIPEDLIAIDIRHAIHYLGEITGEITTDEILGNIFKNFCIGK
jgi:tRNA modification GTPase